MEQKRKLVLMGNDAVGEAALRCGCTFFAGYPISPQTQILDYLAREMPKRGCSLARSTWSLALPSRARERLGFRLAQDWR